LIAVVLLERGNLSRSLSKLTWPGGALADQGQTWNAARASYLFPVKALSEVFRAKYRDGLNRLYAEQALRFTDATLDLEAPRAFKRVVKRV
jgi:hypothetical protein